MNPQLPILLFVATLLPGVAGAQYSPHKVEKLGIRIRIHKKLTGVPLKLGSDNALGAALRAQFIPAKQNAFIIRNNTRFEWGLRILAFPRPKATATGKKKNPRDMTEAEAREYAKQAYLKKYAARNFLDYVNDKDPSKNNREFLKKSKKNKARGKRPAFDYYEYYDQGSMRDSKGTGKETFWYYNMVAVYAMEEGEVALCFHWPVFKKPKPDAKYKAMAKKVIQSLEPLGNGSGVAIEANVKKDKWANTPERKKALSKSLQNIKGVKGWDYFTSQNFICFYSWDPLKSEKRKKSLTFARMLTARMEDVRELYLKFYPPPEGKGLSNYYPVLRICHSQDLFNSYGGTTNSTVGWFNSGSKELVMFNDTEGVYGGKKGVTATAFHEGWHQYADSYFRGAKLNRWFGEGTGDWFGCWTKKGSKWSYAPNMGRVRGGGGIAVQVARKTHVPLRDIVSWNTARFYGPRAPYYYAQGYAMVDFFRRGKKLMKSKWNPAWDNCLDEYRRVMLEEKNQKKAIAAAFGQVDWKELEDTWKLYVKSYISKK